MQSHAIVLDTTGTTYRFFRREKTKGNNKSNRGKKLKYKEKKQKKVSCPPAGNVTKENARKKQYHHTTDEQSGTTAVPWYARTTENIRQTEAQQRTKKHPQGSRSSLCVLRVCSTRHILPTVGLVPCYPGCRLHPAFVDRAAPLERMRQAVQNINVRRCSPPTHEPSLLPEGQEENIEEKKKEKKKKGKSRRIKAQKERGKHGRITFEPAAAVGGTSKGRS